MDTTALVTSYITTNGIGTLAQYNVPAIVTMIEEIAAEDFGGITTTIPADLVEAIVESYRGAAV
jgi:hypothetical protein